MHDEDTRTYRVVSNDEEQYLIWPTGRDLPAGLARGRHRGNQGGMPRAHRRSVDGHAAEELV
jgi:uncharacterized protein YbdZ (MbtH family)